MTLDELLNSDPGEIAPMRIMSYGPINGEYHRAAMFGPNDNPLGPEDVAASPDSGLQLGNLIDIGDGTYRRVADWSYYHPGEPTHNTIELRDRPDMGHGAVRKLTLDDLLGSPREKAVPAGPVEPTAPPQEVQNVAAEGALQQLLMKHLAQGVQSGAISQADVEKNYAQGYGPPNEPVQQPTSFIPNAPEMAQNAYEGVFGTPQNPSWIQRGMETQNPVEAMRIFGKAAMTPGVKALEGVQGMITQEPGQGPLPKLPMIEQPSGDLGQFMTKMVYNGIAGVYNFIDSPEGAAITLASGGSAAIGRLVAMGFTAIQAQQAVEAALQHDWDSFALSLGFAGLGAKGAHESAARAYGEERPVPSVEPGTIADKFYSQDIGTRDYQALVQGLRARLRLPEPERPDITPPRSFEDTGGTPFLETAAEKADRITRPQLKTAGQLAMEQAPIARAEATGPVELNVGDDARGKPLSREQVEAALPEDVQVVDYQHVPPGEGETEGTHVVRLSRPLTAEEGAQFAKDTGQMAVPQREGPGKGTMFVDQERAAADPGWNPAWGKYNEDFFKRLTPPAETPEQTKATKAYVEAAAEQRGMPKPEAGPRPSDTGVEAAVDEELSRNKDAGQALVDELTKNPRAFTNETEPALLRRHIANLEREYEASVQYTNATKSPASAEQTDLKRDQLLQAYNIARQSGAIAGGTFRQIGIGTPLTETKAVAEATAANRGQPLSPKQTFKVKKAYRELKQAGDQLKARQDMLAKRPMSAYQPKTLRDLVHYVNAEAGRAQVRIASKVQSLGIVPKGGIDPGLLRDYALVGLKHITNGVVETADWGNAMLKQFGEDLRPLLGVIRDKSDKLSRELWGESYDFMRPEERAIVKSRQSVQDVVDLFKQFDPTTSMQDALEGKHLKGWYENFSRWMVNEFGEDTPRFARVFASFGANAGPLENTIRALKTYRNWIAAGRPHDIKSVTKVIEDSIITEVGREKGRNIDQILSWGNNLKRSLMASDKEIGRVRLSGPKIDAYLANFIGDLDRATLDRHMAPPFYRQLGVKEFHKGERQWSVNPFAGKDVPVKGELFSKRKMMSAPGLAYQAHLRDVAERLTKATGEHWSTANVQESIWGHYQPLKMIADKMGVSLTNVLEGKTPAPKELIERYRREIDPENILSNEQVQSELKKLREIREAERINPAARAAIRDAGTFYEKVAAAADRARARQHKRIRGIGVVGPGIFDPQAVADNAIIAAHIILKSGHDVGTFAKFAIKEFGKAATPYIEKLYRDGRKKLEELTIDIRANRMKSWERRKLKGIADLDKRIATRDTSPRRLVIPPELDETQRLLQDRYDQKVHDYNAMLEEVRLKNTPLIGRVLDTLVNVGRSAKLMGSVTYGKLTGAGLQRELQTKMEEISGAGLSQVPGLRYVMRAAPTEGPPTLASGMAAFKGRLKGIREIPDVLKGNKEAPLAQRLGARVQRQTILSWPARGHAAVKNPFMRSQTERALVKALRAAEFRGEDTTKADVQQAAYEQAKESGRRAILVGRVPIAKIWSSWLNQLERSDSGTAHGVARVARAMIPIARVPANLGTELAHLNTMGVPGMTKLITGWMRGIKTLQPHEYDFIARSLKKGMVGAALFATGYANPGSFGGLDWHRKDKQPGALKWGEARIFGQRVPRWFLHSPLALQLQLGASVRHWIDDEIAKGNHPTVTQAMVENVPKHLWQEFPFAEAFKQFDEMVAGKGFERRSAIGKFAAGYVPQFLRSMAEAGDQAAIEAGVKRYPVTPTDYMKMNLPGLRQTVTTEKPKGYYSGFH